MKLNIGCGPTWRNYKDYEGVDIVDFGQKYIWDIENECSLQENSVDEIMINHTLEHTVRHVDVVRRLVKILRIGGKFKITVPGPKNPKYYAFGHYSFFTKKTFETIDQDWYAIPLRLVKVVENSRGDIHAWFKKI